MQTRKDILQYWEDKFLHRGLDSPRLSAQVLLAHVLNLPRLEMLLSIGDTVDAQSVMDMETLASRRISGEPVAYLVGSKEFYGFEFHVNPAVLIPRPETELMIDFLLATQDQNGQKTVLDIGTGSGTIAVSCAKLFPYFDLVASDISFEALKIAKENARIHGVQDKIAFFQGHLIEALRIRRFDIILANLPYVPATSRSSLSLEVLEHEPEIALFAGPDGLDCYRALATDLRNSVEPGAILLCEIDGSQGEAMQDIFSFCAGGVRVVQDYSGHDRVVVVVF
jgi:release factor glutamine methyltransferase